MNNQISRRSFIKGVIGAGAAAALGSAAFKPLEASAAILPRTNIASWVWQFTSDGSAQEIRDEAMRRGVGVIIKSHDGLDWMSRWDNSPDAVTGPEQLQNLAVYFARGKVPVHAWCVPTGEDPLAEASMCSEVLNTGVASLYLDLEGGDPTHFWQGTGGDAVAFGNELRRLQPKAKLVVAPDARPWQVDHVPVREFAAFCDEIAPQSYWRLFDNEANFRLLREYGYHVGPEGSTPELMVEMTAKTFSRFGHKVCPIGDGEGTGEEWKRFIAKSKEYHMDTLSSWRHGLMKGDVWDAIVQPEPEWPISMLENAKSWINSSKVWRRRQID